jgi:hypothetical protein
VEADDLVVVDEIPDNLEWELEDLEDFAVLRRNWVPSGDKAELERIHAEAAQRIERRYGSGHEVEHQATRFRWLTAVQDILIRLDEGKLRLAHTPYAAIPDPPGSRPEEFRQRVRDGQRLARLRDLTTADVRRRDLVNDYVGDPYYGWIRIRALQSAGYHVRVARRIGSSDAAFELDKLGDAWVAKRRWLT